ncbi:MAG: hypothetical protein NC191_04825, partial [Muribaculaceae bacterium]|nr:hypothetical protein [Muribaculaceae bacterium]
LRDLIASNQYNKFKFHKMQILLLKEEIHRHIKKKAQNYKHELEFTSQDLRELAEDIHKMLNDWQDFMNPAKHIKSIGTNIKDGQLDLTSYQDKVIPLMTARTECIQAFAEILSLVEYHAVYLYFLELASNDEFAIKCTERII